MIGKPVPSRIYDKKYFLSGCGGFEEFLSTGAKKLPFRLKKCLDLAKIKPGEKVLDIGCGRGETTIHSAKHGVYSIGVDYSKDALTLAKKTARDFGEKIKKNTLFVQGNACKLPFQEKTFDKILMLDIIEHLHPYEFDRLLREAKRVLKDNGMIVIHTLPNKWFYTITYPVVRFLYPVLKVIFPNIEALVMTNQYWKKCVKLPKNPRSPYEQKMHVHEFSPLTLKKFLRKHDLRYKMLLFFQLRYQQSKSINVLSSILSNLWPLNYFVCVDIVALVKKDGV